VWGWSSREVTPLQGYVAPDPDFSPARLRDRVVLGAQQADLVRLHGALTATLNLYPRSVAFAHVWMPALEKLEGAAWQRAQQAMTAHLLHAWQRRTAG
jgi:hypothetical protein